MVWLAPIATGSNRLNKDWILFGGTNSKSGVDSRFSIQDPCPVGFGGSSLSRSISKIIHSHAATAETLWISLSSTMPRFMPVSGVNGVFSNASLTKFN